MGPGTARSGRLICNQYIQIGSNPIGSTINKYMKQCNICGEQFENGRVYSNHVRWKHKASTKECKFCNKSLACHAEEHETLCHLNPINLRLCVVCSTPLTKMQECFCSNSCSAKANNISRQLKIKTSLCMQCGVEITSTTCTKKFCTSCYKSRAIKLSRPKPVELECTICKNKFMHFRKHVKTCSKECRSKLHSKLSTQNPNCGGETNYKRYIYNDVIFDSSWEVEIAKFLDEHQIKWSRSRKHLLHWIDSNGEQRRYYPDFFLEDLNVYVDPKNPYKQEQDKEKLDFIKQSVILIVGNINECKQQIFKLISK